MATTERRVVSVVFADLVDFTSLSERLDAEDVAHIQDAYFAMAEQAVAAHGGAVEKFIGDAVVATFGTSNADDSDVERAVGAALAIVAGTGRLAVTTGLAPGTVQVRVGVNTGEVVVTRQNGGWRVTGDIINIASRLQAAAAAGQVLLGPDTAFGVAHAFVVESHGELSLKGKSDPLPAWRVVRRRAERTRGLSLHGLRAPLLGRATELEQLRTAFARAVGGGRDRPAAIAVVAPPGVGKSRLVAELTDRLLEDGHPMWRVRLGDETDRGYGAVARLLRAAGFDHADDTTRGAALAQALRDRGYDDDHAVLDAAHGEHLLAGAALAAEPVDLYRAWTAALDAAPAAPPVWVIEDFHLAGPDLRAFVRHALEHPRDDGRLIVITARPTSGLDAAEQDLAGVPQLHLEPLTPQVTRELVVALVGEVVPDDYVDGIVASSGGNPLFVEELLRSWIDAGVLAPLPDAWRFTGRATSPVIPSTVHGIYQGQLDALPHPSRSVVERGSVPGITFPVEALPSLGVTEPAPALGALTRAGLLRGPHEHLVSDEAYTYRHSLLRDTAYGSLTRHDRAELHARFARWLADDGSGSPRGTAELVGEHLAVAVEMLPATAAGMDDGTPIADLAAEAARQLEEGADAALVSAPQRAAQLLQRALDLPGTGGGDDRLRRQLLLAEAERRSGRLDRAMASFAAAGEAARAREDSSALVTAALGYEDALFASRLPREVWGDRSVGLLRAADAGLGPGGLRADDAAGGAGATAERSRVLAALGRALQYGGDTAAGVEALERALELADASGDPAAVAYALLALRASMGEPSRLTDRLAGGERIAEAARRTEDGELRLEAERLRLLDLLEAGDLAGADAAQQAATALVEHLGRPLYFWYPPMWRSMRTLLSGDFLAAPARIQELAEVGRRAHYRDVELVRAIQELRLHLDTGRAPQVLAELEAYAAHDPARWSFAPAVVLARAGDLAGARRYLAVYLDQGFENVATDLSRAATLAYLAEMTALTADAAAATELVRLLTPWAGHVVVLGSGALCLGAASHFLGVSLRTAGDPAAAEQHLRDAVRLNDHLGATGLAAWSRAELAGTLLAAGRRDEARDLVRDASGTAHALGMRPLAEVLATLYPQEDR